MNFQLHAQLEADSILVNDWSLCQLRLHKNATLPWLILVPRRNDLSELYDLATNDRNRLMQEMTSASTLMRKVFNPHKINFGMLGNIVPQLHIHIIGRYTNDPAWPGPVWGHLPAHEYESSALEERLVKIRAACGITLTVG
jgi:diadenosine tetraphosphate (Ap4A) HIT family hydrolase